MRDLWHPAIVLALTFGTTPTGLQITSLSVHSSVRFNELGLH